MPHKGDAPRGTLPGGAAGRRYPLTAPGTARRSLGWTAALRGATDPLDRRADLGRRGGRGIADPHVGPLVVAGDVEVLTGGEGDSRCQGRAGEVRPATTVRETDPEVIAASGPVGQRPLPQALTTASTVRSRRWPSSLCSPARARRHPGDVTTSRAVYCSTAGTRRLSMVSATWSRPRTGPRAARAATRRFGEVALVRDRRWMTFPSGSSPINGAGGAHMLGWVGFVVWYRGMGRIGVARASRSNSPSPSSPSSGRSCSSGRGCRPPCRPPPPSSSPASP